MSTLAAKGVTVRLGGRAAVSDVTLALKPGEVLGLIGPNGAGKTTLLRSLAGLLPIASGTVELDGTALGNVSRRERARAIAYLAQDGEIHWAVSVTTLVMLGRLPHIGPWAGPGAGDRAAIADALTACDVAALADRPVTELSGGERARVLLARALAGAPQVLLADEPVAGLDPAHSLDVMAVLRARARAGAAVVVVVHDLTVAARYCDRLALMFEGRIAAEGTADGVLSDANLAHCYGIRVHRGVAGGEPFVVPIARTSMARVTGGSNDGTP